MIYEGCLDNELARRKWGPRRIGLLGGIGIIGLLDYWPPAVCDWVIGLLPARVQYWTYSCMNGFSQSSISNIGPHLQYWRANKRSDHQELGCHENKRQGLGK